ncbi:MAG: hypothetical protein M1308_05680 [Actinobacteria bacterium]|nr:hypothetical protein [Actinomycetota bacterium]
MSEYFKYCVSRTLNTAKEESLFSINPVIKKESSRLEYSHRHFVFSIPKIMRIYFLFDRALLKELSKIAWEVIDCDYVDF